MLLSKLFGIDSPNPYRKTKVEDLKAPAPDLLYGIELEIERASFDWGTDYWNAKEDGSLRNGGVEYVSRRLRLTSRHII